MAIETRPVVVSGTGLCVTIGTQVILRDAELAIHAGERVGVVGRNGAGKSTLLRLVAGTDTPDAGQLTRQRGLLTGFLPQDVALDEDATVRANILAGAREVLAWIREYEALPHDAPGAHELEHRIAAHDGWDVERRMAELVTRLEAPPLDRIVRELSGGEKRRVGICRTLLTEPDLLILDEPTNHLDTVSITWLEGALAAYPGTCLLVTHDRCFLDRVTERILEVAGGRIYSYPGNYTAYLEGKAARESDAERREETRLSFLRREIEWIRRGPKARTTKSRSRIDRYEAAAAQAPLEREQDVDLIIPPAPKLGNRVVELEDVGVSLGGRPLFAGLSLRIEPGARIGIIGRNGVGKTTLLRVIQGQLPPDTGRVTIGDQTRFNYVDQQRLLLHDAHTVLQEVGEGKEFVQLGESRVTVWAYLRRFLFADERIHTPISRLSGGERSRVLLAKILKHGGNVLILDEPTNDLDLATLRMLEEALADFAGCVLLVSHDRRFLNRVCTAILAFEDGGRVVCQEGDYDYYLEKLAERQRAAVAAEPSAAATETTPRRRERRLTWSETRELEGMEPAILAAEARVADLEARFTEPGFFARHAAGARALSAELEEARAAVSGLYARWAELEAVRTAGREAARPG